MNVNRHIRDRFGLNTETGTTTEASQTMANILTRRSHRRFKPEAIPMDLLDTLFATAFSAPSKSDLQQACVIHIKDRDKQALIANLSPKTAWAASAPVFLVWCGDSRRIRKIAEWRGHPFANDHLDAFMNAAVDTGIAMQTFIIAAESLGLGCCPVSEIRDHIQPLSQALKLPQQVFPVAGLCVGWPESSGKLSLRLPMDITVKTDRYDDTGLTEVISDYDQRREALDQTPPEQQRDVQKFGTSESYGWSENRSRQYAQPARNDFGAYIRAQGFDLS